MVLPARLGLSAAAAEHRWIPGCREMSLCWASSHSAKTTGFAEHPDLKISSPPPAFSRPNTLRPQQGLRPKTIMNDSMFIARWKGEQCPDVSSLPWCALVQPPLMYCGTCPCGPTTAAASEPPTNTWPCLRKDQVLSHPRQRYGYKTIRGRHRRSGSTFFTAVAPNRS